MALDVHILDSDAAPPVDAPSCQFEEDVHRAVFGEVQRYPLLSRMKDYYADAHYAGTDLRGLVRELKEVLPKFVANPPVHQVLQRFLEACQSAASQDKSVLCFCD